MAVIRPFRGVRYNPAKVPDLSAVISQPYDRVRYGLQDKYYDLSPYSIVRIIKGKERERDNTESNVYTRARDTCQAWLREGILMRENVPALYVLHQTFTLPDGSTRTRRGLMAALELTRFDEGIVLPHERTHSGPKVDRLNLLRATEVNFGHIFMLYPGGGTNELTSVACIRLSRSTLGPEWVRSWGRTMPSSNLLSSSAATSPFRVLLLPSGSVAV